MFESRCPLQFAVLGYWQSETLPTFKNGFDSHVPLQFRRPRNGLVPRLAPLAVDGLSKYRDKFYGLVAQPGLRRSPVTGNFTGSNPVETANFMKSFAHVV